MKSVYLCRTNFFTYKKEINYPPGITQTKLFRTGLEIPPVKFTMKKVSDNKIKGNITIEEKKEIQVIPFDVVSSFSDIENIELESRDRFYNKNEITIRKPDLLSDEKDICLVEGNSNSIKTLLRITGNKLFNKTFRDEIYLNNIKFEFPKELTEEIGEEIKGIWLKLQGGGITNIAAFGGNVDKNPIIENIKMEDSTKITSINLYIRYNDKTHLYMLTQKGTILFYSNPKNGELDELVYGIFKTFSRYEK